MRVCRQPKGTVRPWFSSPARRKCKRLPLVANSAVEPIAEDCSPRQRVFVFGTHSDVINEAEGRGSSEHLLGGKGKNLVDMSGFGLNVPPGFILTAEVCADYHHTGKQLPEGVWHEAMACLGKVEDVLGAAFGDETNPLLLSVRSGAEVSMPGLMDTVLNLGMNDQVVEAFACKAGKRFAWDSYRRFLAMFGSSVVGLERSEFEQQLQAVKEESGVLLDQHLSAAQLKEVVNRYKGIYSSHGHEFPDRPEEQLQLAVQAAFNSWESEQAQLYRRVNGVKGLAGTAVTVQAMVFGNLGESSGTGVCFTRNPSTGKNTLYGEYLVNAQGEDVGAHMCTPMSIEQMRDDMPDAYEQLKQNCEILEREYKDMQDVEFTVQEGSLFMLQCRSGKRTGAAAVAVACDFVDAGLVGIPDAIMMVEPRHLDQLLQPQFISTLPYADRVIGQGLPASPGAAVGKVVFDSDTCARMAAAGEPVILLQNEVGPEDVKGMHSAQGVLTQLGGMTSQAAVVARGWGKPCITGFSALVVDASAVTATVEGQQIHAGDVLSMNGSTGEVILGAVPVAPSRLKGPIQRFLSWVDEYRTVGVLANADTPSDAQLARDNGAEGIGLVRTEHMLFASDERVAAVRRMIFARTSEEREAALVPIEEFQRQDLVAMFKAMDGLPVIVRLLDPPLHEFLPAPDDDSELLELAADLRTDIGALKAGIKEMQEVNPMLGFRGCRLGIAYPEISRSQIRAIMMAACAARDAGAAVQPGIMVPLVSSIAEYEHQAQLIHTTAQDVLTSMGSMLEYEVGSMIETPRAALLAGDLAAQADFVSLGTNDLTQMTYGLSRDDTGNFLNMYISDNILPADPFQVLDIHGVGRLIESAIAQGRAVNSSLKVGLSGEHGAEPSSVAYLSSVGVDYVSCSTARIPLARLSGAQAVITAERNRAESPSPVSPT